MHFPGHLVHQLQSVTPVVPGLGLEGFGDARIDIGGHLSGARAGGVVVGRDDNFRQFIEHGELGVLAARRAAHLGGHG